MKLTARWTTRVRRALLVRRVAAAPVEPVGEGLSRRRYESYNDYLDHQRSKLEIKGQAYLDRYESDFFDALTARLRALDGIVPLSGRSVLCLAARLGAEVRAFHACGAFAVGIDLNPGAGNRWVLTGDFHALQFGDSTVDVVYTNSFDHVLEPARVIAEIRRVLKPSGITILELVTDDGGQTSFGTFEAMRWTDPEQIVALLTAEGFGIVSRAKFEWPWRGLQVILRRTEHAA